MTETRREFLTRARREYSKTVARPLLEGTDYGRGLELDAENNLIRFEITYSGELSSGMKDDLERLVNSVDDTFHFEGKEFGVVAKYIDGPVARCGNYKPT